MPRLAASSVGIPTGTRARLKPPDDLAEPEREVFLAIVLACRADHFQEQDLPLLCAYCRAVCLERTASSELAAAGYVIDGRPSGWLNILAQATRSLTVVSRLLRLNPVGRLQSAQQEPDRPSHYERMALEARRHDADAN